MLITIARIDWLRPEQGGRKRPALGGEHCRAISRFQNAEGPLLEYGRDLGMIRLNVLQGDGAGYSWIAHIFFSPVDPPNHVLTKGARFELFDGPKCVAQGEILASMEVPSPDEEGTDFQA